MPKLPKIQNHNVIVAASFFALIAVLAIQTTNAQSSKSDVKSVAWYVANIKVAETKNKECRTDSNNVELQSTPECVNALQALELSFNVKR
jgi:hypothetical protein